MARPTRQPRAETDREAAEENATARAPESPVQDVLRLQRTAGNAAVARAILAREGGMPEMTKPPPASAVPGLPGLGSLGSGGVLGLGGSIAPAPIPFRVESRVKAWLEHRKFGIGLQVQEGSISMPEVIAQIRKEVPESLEVAPSDIDMLVREAMGRLTPPHTRGKPSAGSMESEIGARIANALPKPPKSIKFSSSAGSLELTLEGIEASTKAGGAKLTAKAGKEEGEVSVKEGGASVTATASYKGDSFGLKTKVGDVSFGAKVQKENGNWSKWSMSLSIPVLGSTVSARPPAAELKEAVEKANAAVTSVIAHLQAGGSPTDDVVKKQLEAIKPAFEAVEKATKEAPKGPSVTVGVKAQGGAGGWSAGVSLVIEF